MDTERPRKRLVHLQKYIETMGTKSALYSSAAAMMSIGCSLLVLAVFLSWVSFHAGINEIARLILSLSNGVIAIAGGACLWAAPRVFHRAQQIAPVSRITKHNLHELPASETLVRASDRPPSDQGVELLRPAGSGEPTPSQQLLRAISGDSQSQ